MPTHERRRIETAGTPRATLTALLTALLLASAIGAGIAPAAALAETPSSSPSAAPSPDPSASPAALPSPTPVAGPTILGDAVTFYGRGYGHGVGMSQYGARGRALAGEDAPTILAHYYQGAILAPIDPATRIRVLVQSKWAATEARPLVVYGRVTPWSIDGVAAAFPADARLRLIPTKTAGTTGTVSSAWRLVVEAADATVLFDGPAPVDFTVRGTTDDSRLQLWSKPTRYDQYRGSLRVLVQSTTRLSVVNDVSLEQYLPGVVPVEMPPTWPAAALQAQAIAARSYAARRLRPNVSYFDVPDNSSSQIYRGILAEKASTNAAITATAGIVLISGTTIANALFHSTGGGATEANENVYTSTSGKRIARPVSYLRGASDRAADGTPFDASAPYATWLTRTYTRAQLSAWFAADPRTNVGDLVAIDLRDRGVSGRLVSVALIGSAGSRTVSGEIFRAVFNARRPTTDPSLKSTLLDTAPIR
ncbi:MAG: SpoIID/LytB domain-containing protein [Candidatus Limnocylindrales bacterium]|nr:SpoIID/LytB domain-containing protein [Candidatus Limnocylindrales bacterium]